MCALHSFFQDEEKEEKEEKRLRLKWSSCFFPPSETLFFLHISPFYLLLLKISYRCVQERKRVREEEEAVEAQKKNPHHKKMQCHNETGPFLSFLSLGRRCGENEREFCSVLLVPLNHRLLLPLQFSRVCLVESVLTFLQAAGVALTFATLYRGSARHRHCFVVGNRRALFAHLGATITHGRSTIYLFVRLLTCAHSLTPYYSYSGALMTLKRRAKKVIAV